MYWYQNHDRAFTGDQGLHFSRLFDIFTANRTDMALVRVMIPVLGENIIPAGNQAVDFVQSAYDTLVRQFPVQLVAPKAFFVWERTVIIVYRNVWNLLFRPPLVSVGDDAKRHSISVARKRQKKTGRGGGKHAVGRFENLRP